MVFCATLLKNQAIVSNKNCRLRSKVNKKSIIWPPLGIENNAKLSISFVLKVSFVFFSTRGYF